MHGGDASISGQVYKVISYVVSVLYITLILVAVIPVALNLVSIVFWNLGFVGIVGVLVVYSICEYVLDNSVVAFVITFLVVVAIVGITSNFNIKKSGQSVQAKSTRKAMWKQSKMTQREREELDEEIQKMLELAERMLSGV